MTNAITKLKTIMLGGLIVIGFFAHGKQASAAGTEVLTVAGGCFWCVESDFESVPGVKEVTGGGSGHYEAVQIQFDPARVSRATLLSMFLRSVDPTDAGGQFCDRGKSYRTAIFANGGAQSAAAKAAIADAQNALGQKIVTPVLPLKAFYKAEDYHQDYYKGRKLVVTRFGPKRQSEAYKRYRKACGRDARVMALWGSDAPFAKNH